MEKIEHEISKEVYETMCKNSTPETPFKAEEKNGKYYATWEIHKDCKNNSVCIKMFENELSNIRKIFKIN